MEGVEEAVTEKVIDSVPDNVAVKELDADETFPVIDIVTVGLGVREPETLPVVLKLVLCV